MPQNLELKVRFANLQAAAHCARRLGARDAGLLKQTDTYFNIPLGRLKLREEGGRAELIRYFRPNLRGNRYSNFEVIPVRNARNVKFLFSRLFGRSVVVRKRRKLFRMTDVRIHLDVVEGLGSFIEFEVLVRRNRREAERRMKVLWKEFGIRKGSVVPGSYSDLLVKRSRNRSRGQFK